MQLSDFHVILVNDSYRQIVYTDNINETIENEYSTDNIIEIPLKNYTIEDYCEIVESLLEDVNAHKYCNKIYDIVNTMRQVHISEELILDFVRVYVENMFTQYGY